MRLGTWDPTWRQSSNTNFQPLRGPQLAYKGHSVVPNSTTFWTHYKLFHIYAVFVCLCCLQVLHLWLWQRFPMFWNPIRPRSRSSKFGNYRLRFKMLHLFCKCLPHEPWMLSRFRGTLGILNWSHGSKHSNISHSPIDQMSPTNPLHSCGDERGAYLFWS